MVCLLKESLDVFYINSCEGLRATRLRPVWIVCDAVLRVVVETCVHKSLFDSQESADLGHIFVLLKEENRDSCLEVARDGWGICKQSVFWGPIQTRPNSLRKNLCFPQKYEKCCNQT
jgi:hypothetical protein